MTSDLFPPDVGRADSPRLAWLKRHRVRIAQNSQTLGFCAWLAENEAEPDIAPDGTPIPKLVPRKLSNCGIALTEDDALAKLARIYGLRLWNEENP